MFKFDFLISELKMYNNYNNDINYLDNNLLHL